MKDTWSKITIADYQEIVNIEGDTEVQKAVELISILTNSDVSDIRKYPLNEFFTLNERCKFVYTTSPDANFNKTFILNDIRYGFIPDLNYISTGEWLDCDNWKDKSIENMNNYAALLFRPVVKYVDDMNYTIEEHTPEGFSRRAELFKDISLTWVYGAQVFFSLFMIEFLEIMPDFLTDQTPKKKKKDMKMKTTLKASKKNKMKPSTKHGDGII